MKILKGKYHWLPWRQTEISRTKFLQNKPSQTWRENDQWKKRNSERKSYEKDIENEKLKILRFFSQLQNEPTQFEEKDEYTLFGEYVTSKMTKLKSQ